MGRRALLIIHLTVFIDMVGFGVLLPVLPYVALDLGAGGLGVGALLTWYSVGQLAGAPLLGLLSNRAGRRPVLLLSLAGSAITLTLTGLSTSMALLLAARAAAGVFAGSISTAQAAIADVTEPANRARSLGMLGATIGFGFVFGPALGGLLAPLGFATTCYVTAGLAAANFTAGLFLLPETRPPGAPRPAPASGAPRPDRLALARSPQVTPLLVATFFAMLAFVALETAFPLIGEARFSLNEREMGLTFAGLGVVLILVQGGLVGRLSKRFGGRSLVIIGSALVSLSFLGIALSHALALTLACTALLAAGQGLLRPSLAALLSNSVDAHRQGAVMGLSQSMSAGARAAGPPIAGWLFDVQVGGPFFLGAGVAALVVAVALRLPLRPQSLQASSPSG